MRKLFHVFCLISVLFTTTVMPVQAYAQALPAARMATAVGKSIITKMKLRGFAANDPRYAQTLTAAGVSLTDVAVTAASAGGAAAIGAVGAPVWLTIAASLALGYGLQLALDYWMPNLPPPQVTGPSQNPAMQVGGSPAPIPAITYPVTVTKPNPDTNPGQLVWSDARWFAPNLVGIPFASLDGPFNFLNTYDGFDSVFINLQYGTPYFQQAFDGIAELVSVQYDRVYCNGGDVKPSCTGAVAHGTETMYRASHGQCPGGYAWNGSQCMPPSTVEETENKTGTPQDMANGGLVVGDGLKGSPLNPEIIARLANEAWRIAASKPGYQGVPYEAADPVTAYDVAQAYSPENNTANDPYPTVGDALAPVSAPNTVPNIVIAPNTSPSSGVDLGPDPGIAAPVLEATPTPAQILSPIMNLMPSLRSFVVPNHESVCPKPSMNIFGRDITMETHCTVTEAVRPTLYAVMAAVWVLCAAIIILRA